MSKLNFSFICDHASITKDDKVNINGIFDRINTKKFPAVHASMYLVVNLREVSNGDNFVCELVNEDNPKNKIVAIQKKISVGSQKVFGFVGQLVNIKFPKPGKYIFNFFVNDKRIGSHCLELIKTGK